MVTSSVLAGTLTAPAAAVTAISPLIFSRDAKFHVKGDVPNPTYSTLSLMKGPDPVRGDS